jgi:hypothetical protein
MLIDKQLDIIYEFLETIFPMKHFYIQKWDKASKEVKTIRKTNFAAVFALAPKTLRDEYANYAGCFKAPLPDEEKFPPLTICGKPVTYYKDKSQLTMRIPMKLHIGPRTEKQLAHNREVVEALNLLNGYGYDIYFGVHPSTCPLEGKMGTCPGTYVFPIEFDNLSLKEQEAVMQPLGDSLVAKIFTGNKSIHWYLRFHEFPEYMQRRVLIDIQVNESKAKMVLRQTNGKYDPFVHPGYRSDFIEWREMVERVYGMFGEGECSPDPTLKALNSLLRLPTFRHGKTGKPAEVLEQRDWHQARDLADNPIALSMIKPTSITPVGSVLPFNLADETGAEADQVSESEDEEVDFPEFSAESSSESTSTEKPNHMETLGRYFELRKNGIDKPGMRDETNRLLARAHKVLALNVEEAVRDYSQILVIKNVSGLTNEEAKESYRRLYSVFRFTPYYPMVQSLNLSCGLKVARVRVRLMGHGLPRPTHRLLIYLWETVQKNPMAAIHGDLSLQSRRMKAITTDYAVRLKWLTEVGVVKCTDESYNDHKTRRYLINVILLMFMLGFEDGEMVWGWENSLDIAS